VAKGTRSRIRSTNQSCMLLQTTNTLLTKARVNAKAPIKPNRCGAGGSGSVWFELRSAIGRVRSWRRVNEPLKVPTAGYTAPIVVERRWEECPHVKESGSFRGETGSSAGADVKKIHKLYRVYQRIF
jgi:hypothetical protein